MGPPTVTHSLARFKCFGGGGFPVGKLFADFLTPNPLLHAQPSPEVEESNVEIVVAYVVDGLSHCGGGVGHPALSGQDSLPAIFPWLIGHHAGAAGLVVPGQEEGRFSRALGH